MALARESASLAQLNQVCDSKKGTKVSSGILSTLFTCNAHFLQGVNNFYWKINKCPHITLASLKAMDLDREVVIHSSKKFQSWI
jgi:hypothetical protein